MLSRSTTDTIVRIVVNRDDRTQDVLVGENIAERLYDSRVVSQTDKPDEVLYEGSIRSLNLLIHLLANHRLEVKLFDGGGAKQFVYLSVDKDLEW